MEIYYQPPFKKILLSIALGFGLASGITKGLGSELKYVPGISLLSQDNTYFRRQLAPDYWALSPHYVGQQTNSSCSVATVTMVINGFRKYFPLLSSETLATHSYLLEVTQDSKWKKATSENGGGIGLNSLEKIIPKALLAFKLGGLEVESFGIEEDSVAAKEAFHQALIANERSAGDFIILNYDEGMMTGSEEAGHFSPVGAYDQDKRKILIFDVNREEFEPYWVPEDLLFRAMSAKKKGSSLGRGYLWIKPVE